MLYEPSTFTSWVGWPRSGPAGNSQVVENPRQCQSIRSSVDPPYAWSNVAAGLAGLGDDMTASNLFADVVRSMDIAAAVDPERLRDIMAELLCRSTDASLKLARPDSQCSVPRRSQLHTDTDGNLARPAACANHGTVLHCE
jgi:hypothetical protein